MILPLAASTRDTVVRLVLVATTICLPSGQKATEPPSLSALRISLPLATSHSSMLPSQLPVAAVLPSGEMATHMTDFWYPTKERISLPLAASHNRIVLSSLPEATALPSGENATE